jgi:Protein of unknown function (DUF732)
MSECTSGPSWPRPPARVITAVVASLALTACGNLGTSPAQLDARFVESVRSDGHSVPQGDSQATLVAAARKICDRRDKQATIDERERSALTSRELKTITQVFAGDARRFASLALDTYCPS